MTKRKLQNRRYLLLSLALLILAAWPRPGYSIIEIENHILSKKAKRDLLKSLPRGRALRQQLVYMTGYCGETNTPPGSDEIARPPYRANLGDGSFENPITLAVNPMDGKFKIPYNTMIYIPDIGWVKAEDYCGTCVKERDLRFRIDLWLGMDATEADEYAITGWRWVYVLVE